MTVPAEKVSAEKIRKLPPMLTQYIEYKDRYPDCLILFQVGDFYEVFFDDAVTVASALNVTLTSRDKNSANPIPMCGVPIGVVDTYLDRLVDQGRSVALVSQSEPARPGKGMVARKLDRIVTPGIKLLSGNNSREDEGVVAALFPSSEQDTSLVFSNVQSGILEIRDGTSIREAQNWISRISPQELILPAEIAGKKLDRRTRWVKELERSLGERGIKFRVDAPANINSQRHLSSISGYSTLGPSGKRAVKLLTNYIDEITVEATIPITEVKMASYDGQLLIDSVTRTNLELVRNAKSGTVEGSLLHYLDRAGTAGGSRLLRQWVLAPLASVKQIKERQEAVAILKGESQQRTVIRERLKFFADLERIAARTELSIVTPRELGALRDASQYVPEVIEALNQFTKISPLLESLGAKLSLSTKLSDLLQTALSDSLPASLQDGGVIRDGFNQELDNIRSLKQNGRSWIAELEEKERKETGISSLKIKFNNVLGFFIEVTKANVSKIPESYIKKQATTNAQRYLTTELAKLAEDVLSAEEKETKLEKELYAELRGEVLPFTPELRKLAAALSELDALISLGHLADSEGLTRPSVDDSKEVNISEGRHPVLSSLLGTNFISNSMILSAETGNFLIVTGPNMGGKSTYLRQAALIAIMAQIGSFVPAREAQIGIFDKIYARLGASDDLHEGESTFMVEMREAANIVAGATDRSLVLIDEIGRGTATADGLAIAQAILEWLVSQIGCRSLFATHFHDLTVLEDSLRTVRNVSVSSVDTGDNVIFTHEIRDGAANESYGIEVAKLAGLPFSLLKRARSILLDHRTQKLAEPHQPTQQISLFADPIREPEINQSLQETNPGLEIIESMREIDTDNMTPIEALGKLAEICSKIRTL